MIVEIEIHKEYPSPFGYKTFIKYYPRRFQVSAEYEDNRSAVYLFKGGNNIPKIDELFIEAIISLKRIKGNVPFWLCVIPSSTIERTTKRYKNFCIRISNITSINNGYNLLTSVQDRGEVHASGVRDYNKVLECIEFNPEIRGKNIILIDDVITTGRSFQLISTHLKQLGANSVYGIMLAKTHWIKNETTEDIFEEVEGFIPLDIPPNIPPDLEFREPLDDNFF